MYKELTANIILNGGKTESFSPKGRNKSRMSTLTTFIQHSTGSPSNSNQIIKGNKIIQISKEEVKLTQFADDIIPYIKHPKDATKKLLELIHEFIKVTGYTMYRYMMNFHTLKMRHHKGKLRKQSHIQLHQK